METAVVVLLGIIVMLEIRRAEAWKRAFKKLAKEHRKLKNTEIAI